ncbi:hypothetical protein [Morganella psychrotolerans]|nr:hypothetical protein [Morganella psychrotolerans]
MSAFSLAYLFGLPAPMSEFSFPLLFGFESQVTFVCQSIAMLMM